MTEASNHSNRLSLNEIEARDWVIGKKVTILGGEEYIVFYSTLTYFTGRSIKPVGRPAVERSEPAEVVSLSTYSV